MITRAIFFVLVIILNKKRNITTFMWLTIVLIFNYLGFIAFLLLSDFSKDLFKKKIEKSNFNFELYQYNKFLALGQNLNQLQILNTNLKAILTTDNKIDLFFEGSLFYQDLYQEIKRANKNINLEFFIFDDGNFSRRLIKLLALKLKEGVKVNIIIDAMGNHKYQKKRFDQLKNDNFTLAIFNKISIFLNHSNHRKIVVIDGKIAYIGGMNIGDDYDNKGKIKPWRDLQVKFKGSCVYNIQQIFLEDLIFSSKKEVKDLDSYFNVLEKGNSHVQILKHGPHEEGNILYCLIKMILSAKKSIIIQSPYFVINEVVFNALMIAKKSGVEIKLMIPSLPDNFFVHKTSLGYGKKLVALGGIVYLYQGFIHSKALMIDNEVLSIGSCNMDNRSFINNFEINSIIYDKNICEEFLASFSDDCLVSERLLETELSLVEVFCSFFSYLY